MYFCTPKRINLRNLRAVMSNEAHDSDGTKPNRQAHIECVQFTNYCYLTMCSNPRQRHYYLMS